MLEIIYRDEYLVAINKPAGLLVHASPIARDAEEFAIQRLRDQIGQLVYPCHRLDRKTAGVLLFALDKETHRQVSDLFMNNEVEKYYHAIVRGYIDEAGECTQSLINDKGKRQEAHTLYRPLKYTEMDFPSGKFPTSRYTLMELKPITGRMHQLRKHMDILRHPIIGDRPYGCNKQNKIFLERFNLSELMLNCRVMEFIHPKTNLKLRLEANYSAEMSRIGQVLNLIEV